MKTIRILAVLALILFVVEEMGDFAKGFMRSWNETVENTKLKLTDPITLELDAKETLNISTLYNKANGQELPYIMKEADVDGLEYPAWYKWHIWAALPFIVFGLYGFYSVLRLIITVSCGVVFTKTNVYRMRIFVYSLLAAGMFMELCKWLLYNSMASQVSLEGYEVVGYSLSCPWFSYIMLALFTEIFAIGVKLKEEQDLTI